MKNKNSMQHYTYTFQRSQIANGDVRDFLAKYDPHKLNNDRLAEFAGRINFRFANMGEAKVPVHSELRILLRHLHAIWPWSAYFMDLTQPLGPDIAANKKPLLSLAMCVCDRWCDETQARLVIRPQIQRFLYYSHESIDRLGKRAQLQSKTLVARHEAVAEQFQPILKYLS
jgi:hypothetical protein